MLGLYHFCPLLCPFLQKMFPWYLIFLKRSLIFPILLFPSNSLHWSLRKAFLLLLAILWNSASRWIYLSFSSLPFTSLLFSAICKASSENHFVILCFLRMRSIDRGSWHCTGGSDQDNPQEKEKAKWLSEEALQISEKEERLKTKEKRKDILIWMKSTKEQQGEKRKPSPVISAKK